MAARRGRGWSDYEAPSFGTQVRGFTGAGAIARSTGARTPKDPVGPVGGVDAGGLDFRRSLRLLR